jgi:hypothetical protein
MPTLRELLTEPGLGDVPEFIRPYVTPLTRSIAAPPGSKLLPSRSGAREAADECFGGQVTTEWTPWGVKEIDPHGYRLSSGPQAGMESRPALGQGYQQNSGLWKLSGVAEGWSRPFAPTPAHAPTPKMAVGTWTPFGGASAPLPSNPTPAQMIRPGF